MQLPQGLTEFAPAPSIHSPKILAPIAGLWLLLRRPALEQAGACWTGIDSVIGEMSMFTNNQIRLLPANEQVNEIVSPEENGVIVSHAVWRDGMVRRSRAASCSGTIHPSLGELNRSSERCSWRWWLSRVLLLLISISLNRWVRRPLHRIMDTLKRDDPKQSIACARTAPSSASWRAPCTSFRAATQPGPRNERAARDRKASAQTRRRAASFAETGGGRPSRRWRRA